MERSPSSRRHLCTSELEQRCDDLLERLSDLSMSMLATGQHLPRRLRDAIQAVDELLPGYAEIADAVLDEAAVAQVEAAIADAHVAAVRHTDAMSPSEDLGRN